MRLGAVSLRQTVWSVGSSELECLSTDRTNTADVPSAVAVALLHMKGLAASGVTCICVHLAADPAVSMAQAEGVVRGHGCMLQAEPRSWPALHQSEGFSAVAAAAANMPLEDIVLPLVEMHTQVALITFHGTCKRAALKQCHMSAIRAAPCLNSSTCDLGLTAGLLHEHPAAFPAMQ